MREENTENRDFCIKVKEAVSNKLEIAFFVSAKKSGKS